MWVLDESVVVFLHLLLFTAGVVCLSACPHVCLSDAQNKEKKQKHVNEVHTYSELAIQKWDFRLQI